MINLLGDVYLDNVYNVDFDLKNFIFNLEYPLSTKGKPAKYKVNLGSDNKDYIKKTFKNNPLAVNLANNHIMDYGEEAYIETINYLEDENIKYFGAGNINNNFNNPLILDLNNKKIALFSYCCLSTSPVVGTKTTNGAAPLEMSLITKDINEVKKADIDFTIINLHWGDEEISYPKPSDIKVARQIVDLGADIIIGHHAHVIQSIETYKEKKIFYGIGNFLFPDLNVPKMFDGSDFTGMYKKKQNKKNKESIIINLNKNLEVSWKTAFFDNNIVSLKKTNTPKWLPKTEKEYKIYYKVWSKQRMIEMYLQNPRIPTFKQLKLLLGIK